jgi:hypothetical protein
MNRQKPEITSTNKYNKRCKTLSSKSRRTPKQVLEGDKELNDFYECCQEAHTWALQQLNQDGSKSAEQIAREASVRFEVHVLGNTIR